MRTAHSPFVLRLSKHVLSTVEGDGRRFAAHEGPWFESLTTNGPGPMSRTEPVPGDADANGGLMQVAPSPFVLRLSKDGRWFAAHEGPWFEGLTTNGTRTRVSRTR